MNLSTEVLKNYSKARHSTFKKVVCHAPFVSMNFEQNGNVRACCYNFKHVLGSWPNNSISEIWKGKKAQALRNFILNNELGGGCSECGNMIVSGNHNGVRARFYDEYAPNNIFTRYRYLSFKLRNRIFYPKVMEFELSNNCNLECVMCNGYFSSSIRKNREKLPATQSPYNEKFIDELEEFIPHLTDAKFLGGEPFMIDIYLKIWERILKINPKIKIHITTNGTFLTPRVIKILEGLRAGIILSIDSVERQTYNKIRINGNFDKVMQNLDYFIEYSQKKKTFISMAVCPITLNWHELPQIRDFCIEKNISLYCNAVFTPEEYSLKEQPIEKQKEIIEFLKSHSSLEIKGSHKLPRNMTIAAYNDFIKLLEGWVKEREALILDKSNKIEVLSSKKNLFKNENDDAFYKLIIELIELYKKGYFDKEAEKQNELKNLLIGASEEELCNAFQQFILAYYEFNDSEVNQTNLLKAEKIASLVFSKNSKAQILDSIAKAPPLIISETFVNKSIDELTSDLMKS
jgi:MoaA/NifB/PqqE/SkfB family radical SAM enzyme